MKCIQAVKETKHSSVGDIKRVSNIEANEKVDTKYWKFVSKSQWKSTRSEQVREVAIPTTSEVSKESNKSIKKKS